MSDMWITRVQETIDYGRGDSLFRTQEIRVLSMAESNHDIVGFVEQWYPEEKMIISCSHCGQFGARKTKCGSCGASIGEGE